MRQIPYSLKFGYYWNPIPVTLLFVNKGPSQEQKDLQKQQAAFYQQLTDSYNKQFANQTAVLNAVRAVYDPIMKAGPGQYGFTKEQDTTLRTQASEGTAHNYEAAVKAAGERIAAQGGGNFALPSGAQAQITEGLAATAAESESEKQLSITDKGYDVGRQLFAEATAAEENAAQQYNPLGFAGAATNAGKEAFDEATQIAQMDQGVWGTVGGILGGIAGDFAGGFGGGLGQSVGKGMFGGKKG